MARARRKATTIALARDMDMLLTRAAREQGLADNSPEMVEAVRAELEPVYGSWGMFEDWLPLNVEGVLRTWSESGGAEGTPTP